MSKNLPLFFAILISLICCSNPPATENGLSETEYFKEWKNFKTILTKKEKAPQPFEEFDSIQNGIKLIHYPSGNLKLKGLLNTKHVEKGKKKPAVVYLHGGFSLGYSDVLNCAPFTYAGFIVFAPSYRGENGNGGHFELFMGEVADAKAAIYWLVKQPFVKRDSIFVFGHSIGGAMSLHLSLHPDLPINKSGSSAGLYDIGSIEYWTEEEGWVPYNIEDELENYFRLPVYALDNMVRPHLMYIGKEDDYEEIKDFVNDLYPILNHRKIQLIGINGDHFTSLKGAMELFVFEIENN